MLHQLKNYIKHCLKSFHLHGIHSPFVFTLEKKCLRDKTYYEQYDAIRRFRESVKNNHTILHIEDYGAGSKVFKTDERRASDILKYNSSDRKSAEMLFRLCNYFNVSNVLELGTSIGIATHAMALSGAHITTIEGSPEVQKFAQSQFEKFNLDKVKSVCSKFDKFLSNQLGTTYDLIYIDGHHDGMATINYFNACLKLSHKDTIFILDDIYWSQDMTDAWNQLCQHANVTASIDLYDVGLLFLRKEQLQERFYIKL
ncbi:putative O-methyltransferase [Flavobacteria bacterium BBFL7]|nr:putative O-methyltransferase [Flavobacteria bacterium BBFL7]